MSQLSIAFPREFSGPSVLELVVIVVAINTHAKFVQNIKRTLNCV